jgi:isopenicillin-N epimerase
VDQLFAGATERTRAIVVSHITSQTALRFPVEAICRRARELGILTIVDGAHTPGQIALDLEALGADFYTGNLHKWLCSPKGAAFLYARPERQAMLQPLVVSWGYEPREPGPSPFLDLFDWIGTDDPSAYLSVPAAVAFQRQHDWPAVRAACHALAVQARRRIAELTGQPQVYPDTDEWWAQMTIIPLPTAGQFPAAELQARLFDEHLVEVPLTEWEDRHFVRVSIQAYNSERDVDRLVAGLAALLR